MTKMKTLTLGLSAAALAIGGVACAQAPAPHAKKDADGNGVITRAEAQASATQMFARLDVNKDGKLDKADHELGRQQMRDKMFAKLDANADGSISKAEFAAEKGPGREPGEGRPGDRMGKDGHRGPGKGFGGRHHGFGGPRGGGMMHQADADKDGAISQAEFVAGAMKRFDAQDANHDGQVTKEERQAAREAMKAEWKAKADKKPAN
ncbi:EF-hand domain-containing protein [Novosphingobium soli]|uniref:EF-hand domain-containing protein n=1 Tax=Novosphingobium soli TaxID=574956 RepID=A0ABV6D0L7_9SPHN